MAYNNNNRGYNNNNNGGGYNNNNNAPQYKRSGAKYTSIRNGKLAGTGLDAVNAWKLTRNGLLTASAFPVDGVEHQGQRNDFLRYVVTVANASAGTTQTYWCLMTKSTRKIVIKELGLVISPNGSGKTKGGKVVTGFFGKNHK